MPTVSNHDYPGYEILGKVFNISAAASFPSTARIVATSGQIADDPINGTKYVRNHTAQFETAMRNIEKSLASASPHLKPAELWSGVFNMTSFHVGVLTHEDQQGIAAVARKYFGTNKPAWAAICCLALFPSEALVEIQVQAAYENAKA